MSNISIEILEQGEIKNNIQLLVSLWEGSVTATHGFLSKKDIETIKPKIYEELTLVENLVIIKNHEEIHGFMGVDINKIELLFIHSGSLGKGYGKKLVEYGFKKFNLKYVDVNEDNVEGVGFYNHLGFKTYRRSSHDDMGNPLPILQMKKEK